MMQQPVATPLNGNSVGPNSMAPPNELGKYGKPEILMPGVSNNDQYSQRSGNRSNLPQATKNSRTQPPSVKAQSRRVSDHSGNKIPGN
jgi:hypothetical protein